ncbi:MULTISPECIES: phospholipase effector Tle1 domain-containing protein [unclassified Marinomonas]|uniref:phospholipase effector Tle1 domain-containing protein n=1 Tax=unclassified Marinomonas TaxID=196814 RepID=UPI0007AFCDA1|nr:MULTISPECIES: DUF2235 domain-containing protein [unclassified Marinomonas]
MAALAGDGTCIECEALTHWVELHIIDEHNKGFAGIKGLLTDGAGTKHEITLKDGPILVKKLAAGPVTLVLDNETWLAETQTRKPDDGSDPEIAKSLDENLTKPGNKASVKELQSVTTGDLIVLEGEQKLPEKHVATGCLNLIADNSYVIKVAGFNYLTLRLGVFFDGTNNNTYSAQWGKTQFEGYYYKWKSHFDRETKSSPNFPINRLSEQCFKTPNDGAVEGSATNEVTNVEKLKNMYLEKKYLDGVYIDRFYFTGVGTDNEEDNTKPADESINYGKGLALGDYGLETKMDFAIQKIADDFANIIKDAKNKSELEIDGLTKIEFDVFGFSRGAATGRDFINHVLDGPDGELATKIIEACDKEGLVFSLGFDWLENKNCEVTFAGLYDTVASLVNIYYGDIKAHNAENKGIRLWLDPERVSRVVHLTAHPEAEYRYNFCLNLINDPDTPHFHEYVLPGSHSDLGGGYHAVQSFGQADYLLPAFERKHIATKSIGFGMFGLSQQEAEKQLNAELDKVCQNEISMGWPDSFNKVFKTEPLGRGGAKLTGEVWLQRKVEGDLSRLYLRLMYGLANFYQVPIEDTESERWKEDDYKVKEIINGLPFSSICEKVLEESLKGEVWSKLTQDNFRQKLFGAQLIHHSSAVGTAFKPHFDESKGRYYRKVFECHKADDIHFSYLELMGV